MSYTLAVTSCRRHALLQKTLDSFIQWADVLPEATIILEDSDSPKPAWLSGPKYRALGWRGMWKCNGQRRGQIFSIDSLYDEVETEYVFHLEDDWLFTRDNFVRRSMDILKTHKLISCVSLRGNDCNGHPLIDPDHSIYPFRIQLPYWQGGWGGYSFNPGLRRTSDLKHFGGSFGCVVGYGNHGCGDESMLSKQMLNKGFRIAVLDERPHVKHIGEGVSRAIEPLPPMPKVLLAIPVTSAYDYGNHTSGIKRITEGRLDALRSTWLQDTRVFPNIEVKMFDGPSLGVPDDYAHLPHKTRAMCNFAQYSYDFLVKADDDTALYVDRLLRSGFDRTDQMGYYPCKHEKCFCYATGMCYTLSKRAMGFVAQSPLFDIAVDKFAWAEDYTVGKILRANGIKPKGHPGWITNPVSHYVKPPFPRITVAAHSVTPDDMRAWYASLSA